MIQCPCTITSCVALRLRIMWWSRVRYLVVLYVHLFVDPSFERPTKAILSFKKCNRFPRDGLQTASLHFWRWCYEWCLLAVYGTSIVTCIKRLTAEESLKLDAHDWFSPFPRRWNSNCVVTLCIPCWTPRTLSSCGRLPAIQTPL